MLLSLLCLLVPSPAPAQLRPRLQVGWLGYASQREALFVESVVAKSDAHFGVEGDIRLDVPLLIGVGGRWVATAKFSLDTVTAASGELRSWFSEAFLGHRLLNGRFGIQQRIFRGAFGERSWEFWRVGAQSTLPTGIPGLELTLAGAIYVDVTDKGDLSTGSGRDAEIGITYVARGYPRAFPHQFTIRYRYERFTEEAGPEAGGNRRERVRSVAIGVGYRFR